VEFVTSSAEQEPVIQHAVIRQVMRDRLMPVLQTVGLEDLEAFCISGKMLRGGLTMALGGATGREKTDLVRLAAGIELLHAGSLLHDDVLDGAEIRRMAPAFWVTHGASGAILLGDVLFFAALQEISAVEQGRWTGLLSECAGRVCLGESIQELRISVEPDWRGCEQIAREKTGPLFAFAARAAAEYDAEEAHALFEAGMLAGTAYQLADDLLDVAGREDMVGKSLGRDAEKQLLTAAGVAPPPGVDWMGYSKQLLNEAVDKLGAWPKLQDAWCCYSSYVLTPAMQGGRMTTDSAGVS
jgi:geranylgeranyl pyrophosphate synthase